MSKIFISYKRQDKDKVFHIVDEIRWMTGVDCWIDIEGIESGDQFQNVIIEAIDNADIVIFMLSKNFVAPYKDKKSGVIDPKKQTFPEKEVMYALRHDKRLVPISIDGTTVYDCKWLEFNCCGLDCITWNDDDQRNKFYQNISTWFQSSNQKSLYNYNKSKVINRNIANLNLFFRNDDIIIHTSSGIIYTVYRQGNGRTAFNSDKVVVHYEGFLLDGTKFDSSLDRGEPATFVVNQVIQGWVNMLNIMRKGMVVRAYIPANLAYGEYGASKTIPPNSSLIFDIYLLDIL